MTLVLVTTWASVDAQTLGTIRRDVWTGVGGSAIRDLTDLAAFPDSPSSSGSITLFEGPTNSGDNYGSRIVGYVHPVITGVYTFWLAGDDNCELWLSTDETPDHRQRIAQVPGWTNSRQWTKF
ncbi:MAG: PA14 domain-containing protein, partial [Verrucomicrobiota bacterium]